MLIMPKKVANAQIAACLEQIKLEKNAVLADLIKIFGNAQAIFSSDNLIESFSSSIQKKPKAWKKQCKEQIEFLGQYSSLLRNDYKIPVGYHYIFFIIKYSAVIFARFKLIDELKQLLVVYSQFQQLVVKRNESLQKKPFILHHFYDVLLRVAAFHGHYALVSDLCKSHPNMINAASLISKRTALHCALQGRASSNAIGAQHIGVIERLINAGADVAARNIHERTPLDLLDAQDPFLMQVIAWHMKWRIATGFYYQHADVKFFPPEYYINLINRGLRKKDFTLVASVACKLGMLTPLHYLLMNELLYKSYKKTNGKFYSYLALIEKQDKILQYMRQVHGCSLPKYQITRLPKLSYDQFCREQMAKEFILQGQISLVFDNLYQFYHLFENMNQDEINKFKHYCQQIAAKEEYHDDFLFNPKDMLGILLTSLTSFLLTDDWLITSLIFYTIVAATLSHSNQIFMTTAMLLLAYDFSPYSSMYALPIFLASTLLNVRLFFSKEERVVEEHQKVIRQDRMKQIFTTIESKPGALKNASIFPAKEKKPLLPVKPTPAAILKTARKM